MIGLMLEVLKMLKPTPTQEKKIIEVMRLMENEIDFVVCGFMGSGKTEIIREARRRLGKRTVYLNETLTKDKIKIYAAGAVTNSNTYYLIMNEFLSKDKDIQKILSNLKRRVPIVVEAHSKYKLDPLLSKWVRVDVYHSKIFEIQTWLRDSYDIAVPPARIEGHNNLGQLLVSLRFGSVPVVLKKSLMPTIEMVIKTTDKKMRLETVEYLQTNFNIKYVLKIILFNTDKFYSVVERLNVHRILSICDRDGNLYALLNLPNIYYKWISRKLVYPKILEFV